VNTPNPVHRGRDYETENNILTNWTKQIPYRVQTQWVTNRPSMLIYRILKLSPDQPSDVPLSSRLGTSIPRRPSHHILLRRFSASSTFCKPTPAHRTSLSSQHIRPSGVFHRWSDGLEFAMTSSEIRRVVLTCSFKQFLKIFSLY